MLFIEVSKKLAYDKRIATQKKRIVVAARLWNERDIWTAVVQGDLG